MFLKQLQQPLGSDLETLLPEYLVMVCNNKLNASSADIYDQVDILPQAKRRAYTQINVMGFLFSGNNIYRYACDIFNAVRNFISVTCIAKSTRSECVNGIY